MKLPNCKLQKRGIIIKNNVIIKEIKKNEK